MRGDRQLLAELMGFFLEDLPGLSQSLQEAAARRDLPTLQRTAHSLKGLAANFDAHQVMTAAQSVELAARQGDEAQAVAQLRVLLARADQLAAYLKQYLEENAP